MGRRLLAAATTAIAIATSVLLPGTASALPYDEWGTGDAYYSPKPTTSWSKSASGMRTFLSTIQPQFSEQAFVWGGPLISKDGTMTAVDFEMQRDDSEVDGHRGWLVQNVSAGLLYHDGKTFDVGGLFGTAEDNYPVSFTRIPWSVRADQALLVEQPEFIDVRVVKGAIGVKGSIIELTANVYNVSEGAPLLQRIEVYVRARDTTGLVQWGYGPSGFAPMWIHQPQRDSIMNSYGGSVGDYLRATDDSMWSQGQNYLTTPLLKVEKFVVSKDGKVVDRGSRGWIWMDYVTRSFDAQAQEVVNSGSGWNEFSVMFPSTGQSMKIGWTDFPKAPGVGTFPYAYLDSPTGPRGRNGVIQPQMTWGINRVHLTPVKSSKWVSPKSGNVYYLKWKARLDKTSASKRVDLTFSSALPNQEAVIAGRAVYEGVFNVTGKIGDQKVHGYAVNEYQIPGQGQ
mgnify:CR=1 FL=1